MSITKTYKDFLFNRAKYSKLKKEWIILFQSLFPNEEYYEWAGNCDTDGNEILDGNPIFSAYFPKRRKAIRIIHLRIEEEVPSMTAWEDIVEIQNLDTTELVITSKIDKTAFLESKKLISQFINDILLSSTIELVNIQFEEIYQKREIQNLLFDDSSNSSTDIFKLQAEFHEIGDYFDQVKKNIGQLKGLKGSKKNQLTNINLFKLSKDKRKLPFYAFSRLLYTHYYQKIDFDLVASIPDKYNKSNLVYLLLNLTEEDLNEETWKKLRAQLQDELTEKK